MYYRDDREQLSMEEFFQPFGGRLRKDNRWVRLADIMPWEYIEDIYAKNLSGETGRPAISSRIALGTIFIKEFCHLTDEGTVQDIQENSYMLYFLGLHEFQPDACERNAIEGRNGNAKRRFGLDRLFSKLDETAKTEAALILLAMNTSLRLACRLALFVRFLLSAFLHASFSAGPNYLFGI